MTVDEDGVIQWLVYIVIALVSSIFAGWNKYILGRIGRVEKKASASEDSVQEIKLGIEKRFSEHEKEERDRDERHAADVTREFKELRSDVNTGHTAILQEVNKLAREIRNNGKS